MGKLRAVVIALSLTSILGLGLVLRSRSLPLGIPGEWVWSRIEVSPSFLDLCLALAGVALYSGFVGVGFSRLASSQRRTELVWVGALFVAAIAVQTAIHAGASPPYGLTKWVALSVPGSSGYFTLARSPLLSDPWPFWADYPIWIKEQDSLHIGTHPPGLLMLSRAMLGLMERSEATVRWVSWATPESVAAGFRFVVTDLPRRERAAVTLMGALILIASSATVVPLYALARASMSARTAWAVAALWPVIPSAILFQPAADTAFPLLSTLALALAAWGGSRRCLMAGVVLAVGMQLTLAYLPVGLAVAMLLIWQGRERGRRHVGASVAATALGFGAVTLAIWAVTGANPFVIWWWNLKNHSRFYQEFPRSYVAWSLVNPAELAVAIGLPVAILAFVGLTHREASRSSWIGLGVLLVLNVSGKNLSEVARLWLPLMPLLLVAAGDGLVRLGAGARFATGMVLMVAVQTLVLQVYIQVVYPI